MWIPCIASLVVFAAAICAGGRAAANDGVTQTMAGASGEQMATLSLISAPGPRDGRYQAGVAITMVEGAHTYWKQPGDAGVPPVFSFNGSDNVAAAEVRFPIPVRLREDGIEAFGYRDKVVFPVVVTPKDAAKPAVLKVDVTYAVCTKICLPAHATATVRLAPGESGRDGAAVETALAAVPLPASPAQRRDLQITPNPGAPKPSWTLSWAGQGALDDVFPEPPEGYFFTTKKLGANRFALTAEQVVTAPGQTKVPVRLTLARPIGGLETSEDLDVGPATR